MLYSYSIKSIFSQFDYKKLSKIDGKPTIESILLLHWQVKRNAQSLPTTLGGGQLGFLALVLPQAKYDTIPNFEPFARPTDPGPFQLHLPSTTNTATTLNTPTAPARQQMHSITMVTPTIQAESTTPQG